MWMTFSPISSSVMTYYDVSVFQLNLLSLIYMFLYIPFVFLASWIVDTYGLRMGIVIGGVTNFIGACVRCIPGRNIYFIMTGQAINALSQTFILSTPVKVAGNWFGPKERTTATSIGAMANQIGIAVGFYMPPAIATSPDNIKILLYTQAGIATFTLLLVLIGFRTSTPPSPPSPSAAAEKTDFFGGLKSVLQIFPFWILLFAFGIGVGVFYALCTLLDQYLEPFGYSQSQSGLLGSLILIIGLGGAMTAGPLLDKTKSYMLLCVLSFLGYFGGLAWFAFQLKAHNFVSLLCACGFIGFFVTAIMPIGLEAGVEATYPVAEGLSSGLVLMSAQIFGIIITLTLSEIKQRLGTKEAVYIQMGLAGLSCVVILLFRTKYKRLLAEAFSLP